MKAPAFQFYPADFIMGTASMIPEEVGGYIRLLSHQWTGEGLPNNRKKLEGLSGISGESLDTVLEKFQLDNEDGKLKNERLERIRAEQMEYRKKQQENGKKGGNPAFKKGTSNPYYNPPDNPKDNPPDMPANNPKINPIPSSSTSSLSNSNPLASKVLLPKEPKQTTSLFPENGNPGLEAKKGKPKEKSCAKKEKVERQHLFADSPYYDRAIFLAAFPPEQFAHVDLNRYYERAKGYSEAKGAKYINWVAAVKNWIREDAPQAGHRDLKNPQPITPQTEKRLATMKNVMNTYQFDEYGNLKTAS